MPPRRQLPWANKGGGSKTRVKQPPATRDVASDIDDNFFDGTILESSRKNRKPADAQLSDDELAGFSFTSAETSSRKGKGASRGTRMLSSSPPPIAGDLPPPEAEYMLMGIDKFDLRDDEWMMVEDELLQTAKLFTRHLHLAEYETLKAKIEEQKKRATARPVVDNAKPSVEGMFKRKAQEQLSNQKKALQRALSTRDDSSEDCEPPPSSPPARVASKKPVTSLPPRRPTSAATSFSTVKALPKPRTGANANASDSDDLHAAPIPKITKSKSTTAASKPSSDDSPADEAPAAQPENFKKPTIPAHARIKAARVPRRNLWDDWDDLTSNIKLPVSESSASMTPQRTNSTTRKVDQSVAQRSSSPTKSMRAPTPSRTNYGPPKSTTSTNGRNFHEDSNTPARKPSVKEAADRSAKRKADHEREEKKKPKYDDIPTFLF